MPMRPYLLLLLLHLSMLAKSQDQFPAIAPTVDSFLNEAYKFKFQNDSLQTREQVNHVDVYLDGLEPAYNNYKALILLFNSFYDFDRERQEHYRERAKRLLSNSSHVIADSFFVAFFNLMHLHYKAGRMNEWMPVDSLLRRSIMSKVENYSYNYIVSEYASLILKSKIYQAAKYLASYEYYVLMHRNSQHPLDKLGLVYVDWLITSVDLEQWISLPYFKRHTEGYYPYTLIISPNIQNEEEIRSHNFKATFNELISRIKEVKVEAIDSNAYNSPGFNASLRRGYYRVYMNIMEGFYNWAVSEHKEGQIILPLKSFLLLELVPDEMEPAFAAGVKPAITSTEFLSLAEKLSQVYHAVGNGQDQKETILRALDVYLNKSLYTEDEQVYAFLSLMDDRVRADRLLRNYDESLKASKTLKEVSKLPDSSGNAYLGKWEQYLKARIEEVYTLMESGNESFKDSLKILLNESYKLDDGSDFATIYSLKAWPHFQYIVALIKAQQGDWMSSLLLESLVDMEKQKPLPDMYYPIQLFYFKSLWHGNSEVNTKVLENLLFYTGRQLGYTFMMLSAEERMLLYEQRLSDYFDVYHELLFSGMLKDHPHLEEKLIAQSLSLKNFLADGNLIPNEILEVNKSERALENIESIRKLRQETIMFLQTSKFKNQDGREMRLLKDRMQVLWLDLLEGSGMDSLVKLTDWKKIASSLKPGQVYTETVRYNKWLSDSTSWYGAYIISDDGKIKLVSLYPEKEIDKLLIDPSASPQTAAINVDGNRGNKILGKKESKKQKSFVPGDVDKLGALLLQPLWPFIKDKKEWFQVQDGLLNRISFAALQWNKKNLFEFIQLNQLSSSASLFRAPAKLPQKATALMAGGLNYGEPNGININRLFKLNYSWTYLPGTKSEVQTLLPIFQQAGLQTKTLSGYQFPDSLITELKNYNILHLATHGFYLDSASAAAAYEFRWNKAALKYEPLFRSGIALSNANDPSKITNLNEGYLLGYELANTDLRNCYLVSLSACETGLGDLRNNLGVDGLSRALKLGGARYLLISLWKVPDQPTAIFMENFYRNLFSGLDPFRALRATQKFMSQSYPATDWAAFVLVD